MLTELMITVFGFLAAAVTLVGAVIALLSARKSRQDAAQAKQAQTDTMALYQQVLSALSEAAQSTKQINDQQYRQLQQTDLRAALEQWIHGLKDDFFMLADVRQYLERYEQAAVSEMELLQILTDLEKDNVIKDLSQDRFDSEQSYHRLCR